MKLVKINAVTTHRIHFNWNQDTKQQLLDLDPEEYNLGRFYVNHTVTDRGFQGEIFVETYETYLVNIDNIVMFAPTTKFNITGNTGGTSFNIDSEICDKLDSMNVLASSSVVGTMLIRDAAGKPWHVDVASVRWTSLDDAEEFEEAIIPVQNYREAERESYMKACEELKLVNDK